MYTLKPLLLLALAIVFNFLIPVRALADYDKVSFYVVAHQDDWQLFMGDILFGEAIDTNAKVVIIHTTAGDASCGTPLNSQYYRARESGAINSLEFCADIHSIHRKDHFDTTLINGHSLRRFTNKNVVDYFLMIPDGCYKCGWRGESLEYLQKREITNLLTVDSMNTYNDWGDLVNTVRAVMIAEAKGVSDIHLSIADVDTSINPADHPDHLFSALAALEAIKEMGTVTTNLFTEYHAADLAPNLNYSQVALKGALYALADFGITQHDIQTKWFNHQEYFMRTYFRTLKDSSSKLIETFLNITDLNQAFIYPNPAHDECYLNYKLASTCPVEISIIDVTGNTVQKVLQEKENAGYYSTRINLANIAKGIYFVVIQTGSSKKSFQLVVT